MSLHGQVALVTGGARRLGRAIGLALAEQGARLVVHYHQSATEAEETAELARGLGVAAMVLPADLADPEQIGPLMTAIEQRFGRLDILVNNAATFQRRPFEAITPADWEEVMAVNLRAPFLCTQQAARLMRRSPRPDGQSAVVVNLADLSGLVPWSGYAHHGVSRAGLLQLTQATARELAPAIRVNAVVAGPILPPPGLDGAGEPWQRILRRVPLGRAGRPDEVAQAVVFLATNAFTTGAILMVDGGEHLRLARRDAPD